jgi:hypothetical protein
MPLALAFVVLFPKGARARVSTKENLNQQHEKHHAIFQLTKGGHHNLAISICLNHDFIMASRSSTDSNRILTSEGRRCIFVILTKSRRRLWVPSAWRFWLLLGRDLVAVRQILLVTVGSKHDADKLKQALLESGTSFELQFGRYFLMGRGRRWAISN